MNIRYKKDWEEIHHNANTGDQWMIDLEAGLFSCLYVLK